MCKPVKKNGHWEITSTDLLTKEFEDVGVVEPLSGVKHLNTEGIIRTDS